MSVKSAETAPWSSTLLILFLFIGAGLFLSHAREQVDHQLDADAGSWHLSRTGLSSDGFRLKTPALEDLNNIPSRVALDSVHWRDQVKNELLKNPWVSGVENLRRKDGRISFSAYLLRPVVGVRCRGGHLLVSPGGSVIEFVPGDFLDAALEIPEYSSPGGFDGIDSEWKVLPGEVEWAELLTLLGDLAVTMRKQPGFIRDLQWNPHPDGGLWMLICEGGLRLEWGKTTELARTVPGAVTDKIRALEKVIGNKRDLIPLSPTIERISLYVGPTPVITER